VSAVAKPALVVTAEERAATAGFRASCDAEVGALLSCLSAGVRSGGRILELGTGMGVGLSWIASGVGSRTDVEVVTVERDEACLEAVAAATWPVWVKRWAGDVEELLPTLGYFDLIFADSEGGKWTRLDLTLAALACPAVLLVDDMDLGRYELAEHRGKVTEVRTALHGEPSLLTVELPIASGMILASRRSMEGG
jgi:predicted O-methyltransferase YrrM